MIIQSPCFNCENRHFKCHSECELYSEYQKEKLIEGKKIYNGRIKNVQMDNYKKEQVRREKKRKR